MADSLAHGQPGRTGCWTRARERREGLPTLLAVLAQHLRAGRASFSLVARLEAGLRDLLHLDAVQLREGPRAYATGGARAADTLTVDVPTRHSARPYVIEARLKAATHLDDWTCQQLSLAAHLAGLVLEIDRHHLAEAILPPLTAPQGRPVALVGSSRPMCDLRAHVGRVAATDFTVLIQGESGTGKELVARQIHELSRRRRGPFIAVNCAAIVESLLEAELFGIEDRTATGVRGRRGKFEQADGGTLFLDEVSDLAPAAQAKLLRVIQELVVERVGGHASRRVDTRIVVATNRGLRELVARGLFREDLFYRLCGVEVHVPALRERREDILELATFFLDRYRSSRPLAISAPVAEALRAHEWPGNVRELERLIEGVVTVARTEWVTLEDLPAGIRGDYAEILLPSLQRDDSLRAWASRYSRLVLERCQGNKRQACRLLGISYHTLQAHLRYRPGEDAGQVPAAWDEEEGTACPPAAGEPAVVLTARAPA